MVLLQVIYVLSFTCFFLISVCGVLLYFYLRDRTCRECRMRSLKPAGHARDSFQYMSMLDLTSTVSSAPFPFEASWEKPPAYASQCLEGQNAKEKPIPHYDVPSNTPYYSVPTFR